MASEPLKAQLEALAQAVTSGKSLKAVRKHLDGVAGADRLFTTPVDEQLPVDGPEGRLAMAMFTYSQFQQRGHNGRALFGAAGAELIEAAAASMGLQADKSSPDYVRFNPASATYSERARGPRLGTYQLMIDDPSLAKNLLVDEAEPRAAAYAEFADARRQEISAAEFSTDKAFSHFDRATVGQWRVLKSPIPDKLNIDKSHRSGGRHRKTPATTKSALAADLLSRFQAKPAFGGVPEAPAFGAVPEAPDFGSVPEAAVFGAVPEAPEFSSVPEAAVFGAVPETPSFGEVPEEPVPEPAPAFGAVPEPDEPAVTPAPRRTFMDRLLARQARSAPVVAEVPLAVPEPEPAAPAEPTPVFGAVPEPAAPAEPTPVFGAVPEPEPEPAAPAEPTPAAASKLADAPRKTLRDRLAARQGRLAVAAVTILALGASLLGGGSARTQSADRQTGPTNPGSSNSRTVSPTTAAGSIFSGGIVLGRTASPTPSPSAVPSVTPSAAPTTGPTKSVTPTLPTVTPPTTVTPTTPVTGKPIVPNTSVVSSTNHSADAIKAFGGKPTALVNALVSEGNSRNDASAVVQTWMAGDNKKALQQARDSLTTNLDGKSKTTDAVLRLISSDAWLEAAQTPNAAAVRTEATMAAWTAQWDTQGSIPEVNQVADATANSQLKPDHIKFVNLGTQTLLADLSAQAQSLGLSQA